jgi:hypothetical protein
MADKATTPRSVWHLAGVATVAQPIGGNLFLKEVLRAGEKWVHPVTKKIVSFTRDELKGFADNFRRMTSQKIDVPVPDGHSYKAADNRGFTRGLHLDGDALMGIVEIPDATTAEQLGKTITAVSASIDPNFTDREGNHLGAVIEHIALTPMPVVTGQGNFTRLTADDGAAVEAIQLDRVPEETDMGDKGAGGAATPTVEQLSAEKEQLSAQVTARNAEIKKLRLAAVDAEVEGLLKEGRIPATDEAKSAVRALLAADGGDTPKLQLAAKGSDGAATTVEKSPAEAFRQFLAAIPKGRICPVGEATKIGLAAGKPGSGEGTEHLSAEDEKADKQAKLNLAAAGMKPAGEK